MKTVKIDGKVLNRNYAIRKYGRQLDDYCVEHLRKKGASQKEIDASFVIYKKYEKALFA